MARVLIMSDIHSNFAALDSVLADAKGGQGFEEVWALGDSIGYGPQPNECISRLREIGALSVKGNHEAVALGEIPLEMFNECAAEAARWTMSQLTAETGTYLRELPQRAKAHGFTLVHGSPRDPVWEYITRPEIAAESVKYLDTAHCVFGHTHVPAVFNIDSTGMPDAQIPLNRPVTLGGGHWFVNPGSVGQPRDGDTRAAYAILDEESLTVVFRRVEYDIALTQKLMEAAGLPGMLIERLSHGR